MNKKSRLSVLQVPAQRSYYFLALLAFFVFFGRFGMQGLSPDAALYSGLALSIAQTGKLWSFGAGSEMFPVFFEHPPFALHWGALLMKIFGSSDGVARAAGAIPAFAAFLLLCRWCRFHFGEKHMVITGIMLLSFGHFTKYAGTFMLEAPLALGVLLVFIAAHEVLNISQGHRSYWNLPTSLGMVCLGCALSTASKGVAGLGSWGALVLIFSYLCIRPKQPLAATTRNTWIKVLVLGLFASLLPMLTWALASYPPDQPDQWPFKNYFFQQVLRSALTNRDNPLYADRHNLLGYVQVIFKYGWPWWWTVPVVTGLMFLSKPHQDPTRLSPVNFKNYGHLALAAWAFFFAFFVPFSLTKIQLPHYLHPTYMPLAPLGALLFAHGLRFKLIPRLFWQNQSSVWIATTLLGVTFALVQIGPSPTPNRGQEFAAFYPVIKTLPPDCMILVDQGQVDRYRMTAFALWYFKTHPWAYEIKVQEGVSRIVFLRFENQEIQVQLVSPECKEFLNISAKQRYFKTYSKLTTFRPIY